MNTLKKIIFLSNETKDNGMGILTLENKNNNIFGSLKTFKSNLHGEYVLGIKFDDRIVKQNVNLSSNVYNFKISEKVNLDNNIGCVLLKINDTSITTIIYGSDKSNDYKLKIISTLRESINKIKERNQKAVQQQNNTKINESEFKDIDISNNNTATSEYVFCQSAHSNYLGQMQNSSSHCQHDNYSQLSEPNYSTSPTETYSQISLMEEEVFNVNNSHKSEIATASTHAELFESDESQIEELIDNELNNYEKGKHKFYDMISDQLKELFDRFPRENNLSNLVSNSQWVKIPTEFDNKFYVVGIITYNDDIKYICYGVPGSYNLEPPTEMRDYSQWLPTDISNPYSNGYWVMYQDADTGENVFIN